MRLLRVQTLQSFQFYDETDTPNYAILSHTWSHDEYTYQELVSNASKEKQGYQKLLSFARQAANDGFEFVWLDTCCIDKTSSAELSEAINSMFHWYQRAGQCYVYLDDVSVQADLPDDWVTILGDGSSASNRDKFLSWDAQFRRARWFTRAWTLQELIAPPKVIFFSREWRRLGTKDSLQEVISRITKIDSQVLQGAKLSNYSVEERLAWAEHRQATRVEDGAYCLLGLFDINMPLLYGEGNRAYERLAQQITMVTEGYRQFTNKDHALLRAEVSRSGIAEARRVLDLLRLDRKPSAQEATSTLGWKAASKKRPGDEQQTGSGQRSTKKPKADQGKTSGSIPQISDNGQSDMESPDETVGRSRSNSPLPAPATNLDPQQYRVITLKAGVKDDPLKGSLNTCSFANSTAYYAVSYVWGDEPALHPIVLNGQTRYIRTNLYHALKRIRQPVGDIRLWVDSVCIKQDDEAEKKAQVRQMAQIYRNAVGVMVWLGEKDSTSDLGLDLIAKILDSNYRWSSGWWADYGFMALSRLLDRPWFSRRWVLQEAAASNNTTIFCGDRQVHMGAFSDAVNLVRSKLTRTPSPDLSTEEISSFVWLEIFKDSPAIRLLDIIETIVRRTTLPLELLVDLARFSITTDRRDVIYSLLSLAREPTTHTAHLDVRASPALVEPDYGRTVLDVYAEFVEQCVHRTKSLDIICRPWAPPYRRQPVLSTSDALDTRSLPSWVSTTNRLPFGDPCLKLAYRQHGKALVDANVKIYTFSSDRQPVVVFGRDAHQAYNGSLRVRGLILGTVERTSMRMASAVIAKECLNILTSSNDAQSIPQRPFSVPDVVWRTMCADRDDQGKPAPIYYRSAMSQLLQLSSERLKSSDDIVSHNPLEDISSIDVEELLETDLRDHVRTYLEIVRDVIWNRRTFRAGAVPKFSNFPLVGLAPQGAKAGDVICLLFGCTVPIVLRKQQRSTAEVHWRLIGDAYVDGIMDGEIIETCEPALLSAVEQEFDLR